MDNQVESLFAEVCDMPPNERKTVLDRRCAGQAKVRSQVDALLAAHDKAGLFLAEPTANFIDPLGVILTEDVGTQIGRYKLLERIGEGGFGVVYMAQQTEPVRRRVALKIIKLGMDTRQVVARFEAERQALAVMDHPHIARVIDGGATDAGRPYFVMELVRGDSITEYCDRARLTLNDRLALFLQICGAIQHAHQKGIIHRDIKPSNVLVTIADGKPLVKVIDFGIAKATNLELTEKTIFTEFRQLIGTPQYMSPEQAERSGVDIDTRSDIYSLGVVLYEILTGRTPLDPQKLRSAAWSELQRIIREDEPTKPSVFVTSLGADGAEIAKHRSTEIPRLQGTLRRDLDWIVLKSLEKDRSRRYATASEFADDVMHYLNDEPVSASPPSTAYKMRKFARRNKRAIAAAAAMLGILLVGLAGTTATAVWAISERTRALKAEQTAAQQAQLTREKATEAVAQADRARRFASLAGSPTGAFSPEHLDRLAKAWEDDVKNTQKRLGPDSIESVRAEAEYLTWLSYLGSQQRERALKGLDNLLPKARTLLGYKDSTFLALVNAAVQGHLASGRADAKYMVELHRDAIKSAEAVLGVTTASQLLPEFVVMLNRAGEDGEAADVVRQYLRQKHEFVQRPGAVEFSKLNASIEQLANWGEQQPDLYQQLVSYRDSLLPPLKQRMAKFQKIAEAMLKYAEAHDLTYPPASSRDKDGQPLLSWRVLILEYLGEGDLYNEFHLNEPWNSAHNRRLIERMPSVFTDPDPAVVSEVGGPGHTTFEVPVGDQTVFSGQDGTKLQEIMDGTSNTILALEVVPEKAVIWTQPADWELDVHNLMSGLRQGEPFIAARCDGSVHVVDDEVDAKEFFDALTPDTAAVANESNP